MKISLVYPEVYDLARFKEQRKEFPPFGVLYLAAVLQAEGHDVRIEKVFAENTKLHLGDCDVVAFSVPSSATLGLIQASRWESNIPDDALVLVGGVHANLYGHETFELLRPDVVSVGEGEEAIVELVDRKKNRQFGDVAGVIYSDAETRRETSARHPTVDISKLPHPARHLLPAEDIVMIDRLSNTNLRMAHVLFSRGCPFPCRFCAVAQTQIQYRSGASARDELISLKERYGIEGFAIVDDNFVVNRKKVTEICEAIEDLHLRWSALSRVDIVKRDLLEGMQRSGCIEIKFGMESGSERILAAMNKKITPQNIREAVTMTWELGIKVKLFIIHGFPGENHETTMETRALLQELAPMVERVSLFRFVPLPGTYVYRHPEQFKLHGTDRDPHWDGDWSKYHIHHNNHHWWGDERDYEILCAGYSELAQFIAETWPEEPLQVA